ncbi:hypothetical protein [Lichenifustis flavocetrariae]|uniref:Uncharacterized protein n=1 Tax=Lichenifustis flavocetrariae TaxID=2949735 RepID=A0AA41Z6Q1_9HYPH|nr:hypothetical protein [Lichenifustis flavocetrariae]MCW6511350.1 hypothetical protein [Lichenifustis flavocetrariae]
MVAATAFKVAFACLDEVKGDDRAAKDMRRAEGGLYNRLVGNPDKGTACTSTPAPRPDVGQGPAAHLDHDLHR